MAANRPRAVFVTRETDYELLIAHHATRGQARFFLETRGQRLEDVEARHDRFHAVLGTARASVPADWRQTLVSRADLNRFLFAPDDVIVAVGQDGLVANVAKYLNGQPVLGVNPAPDLYDGVLVRIGTGRLARLLVASAAGDVDMESRTMVQAELGEGETLLALNEISSAIAATSRPATGSRRKARRRTIPPAVSSSPPAPARPAGRATIMEATHLELSLGREEHAVGFWVREPFPSIATATKLRAGKITEKPLFITSRMNEGGVIFADGIEQDFIAFDWGRQVRLSPASRVLRLVVDR